MKKFRSPGLFILSILFLASCQKVTYRKTAGGMPYKLYKGNNGKKIYAGNIVKYHVTYTVKDSVYFSSFGKLPVYAPVNQEANPYDVSEVWLKLRAGDSIVATQMMDTFIARNPQLAADGRFKKGDRIVSYIKVIDVLLSDSAVTADEKTEKEKFLANEIRVIEKYLADKNIKAVKTGSGVFVEIINPGTGNSIDSGKYVSVNYTGTSFSGKRFDSNTDTAFHHTEPMAFVTGAPGMIKGFDEAVQMMKPGSSARVYIPSLLGYAGNPDPRTGIKPFEHLIFDLTIVDVKDKAPDIQPKRTK